MRKVERKRMNSEHRKYFLVGSLCIAMFLMLGIGFWTMNANSVDIDEDQSYLVFAAGRGTGLAGFDRSDAGYGDGIGARPVLFLKSSIQITGGDGTKSNPFVIG